MHSIEYVMGAMFAMATVPLFFIGAIVGLGSVSRYIEIKMM